MKTKLLILSFWLLTLILQGATISKAINLTAPGTLSTSLTSAEKSEINNLTVSGNMDSRDFQFLRDNMPNITTLDLGNCNILSYTTNVANEIPRYAFYNSTTSVSKTSLTSIVLPKTLKSIGDYAFYNCSGLKGDLIIPNTVTHIGNYAYSGCCGYNGVLSLSNTLVSIGMHAFSFNWGFNCPLVLPNTLKTIGDRAFFNCVGFTNSLTIPSSITSIGLNAFWGCSGIQILNCKNSQPIEIPENTFNDISVVYVPTETAITVYKATTGWKKFQISTLKTLAVFNQIEGALATTITNAGVSSFSSITHLTVTGFINSNDILLMNSNMSGLTDIDISNAVINGSNLPVDAFKNKTTLTKIKLPAALVAINNSAFENCTMLNSIFPLPSSLTNIGDKAFKNCRSLTNLLILNNGITNIGSEAFSNCVNLYGDLILPNSVKTIGVDAFNNCSGFNDGLIISNTLNEINSGVFSNCSFVGKVSIPASVIKIGKAFDNCTKITEISIEKFTTEIADKAFENCSALKKISIARSLPPSIFNKTFEGVNTDICELVIPVGTTTTYKAANYWGKFNIITENGISDTYSLSLQIGNNGLITESNIILANGSLLLLNTGTTKTFVIAPNSGYKIATATYNGVDIKSQIVNNKYTCPLIKSNATFTVTFERISFKLTLFTGGIGAIDLSYFYGETPTFDFTPSTGYKLQSVLYNNTNITSQLNNNLYTIPAMYANVSIFVNFVSLSTDINTPNAEISMYSTTDVLHVNGLTIGDLIALYTVNGQLVTQQKIIDTKMEFVLQKNQIYILKTKLKSYKVSL